MKTLHYALLAVALTVPTIGSAQSPGSVGNVTVALTVSFTAPGAFLRDPETGAVITPKEPTYRNEWMISKFKGEDPISDESLVEDISKISTFKYGNKEILTALLEAGELGEAQSIAGWTIVEVIPMEDIGGHYAVHKTLGSINIDMAIMRGGEEEPEGFAFAGSYKSSDKTVYKPDGEDVMTYTESDTGSYKAKTTYYLNASGLEDDIYSLTGLFTSSRKLSSIKIDGEPTPVNVFGARKLANICGSGPIFDADSEFPTPSLVEGSISIAPGKVVADVGVYGEPSGL